MNEREAEGVLTLALLSSMADGRTGAEEREHARSLFETLSAEHELPSLAGVQQRVLLGKTSVQEAAALLESEASRRMAFEIAVCVADADGVTTPEEQRFLDGLERALSIEHDEAVCFELDAASLVEEPDLALKKHAAQGDRTPAIIPLADEPPPMPNEAPVADRASSGVTPAPAPDPVGAEVNGIVLRYSVLNGALELLPQNLATMAILPLQTRMVFTIGKRYGYSLDAGHIKEFIATLGLGATSQMLENFARKALGKLVKKTLGKTAGKVAKAATGPMMTFSSTYAIGRVAKAYYAGGRTLSAVDLRSMFQQDLARGKALYQERRPEIERHATTLDAGAVLDLVRGKGVV